MPSRHLSSPRNELNGNRKTSPTLIVCSEGWIHAKNVWIFFDRLMFACEHVCKYMYVFICMYIYTYIHMYVCICKCMYVYT